LISGLLSFSYVFDVLLFPLAAWLYRRYGVRRAAVIGVATFSVGLAVLAAGATEPVALWTGAAVAGVANGASSGIVVALGVEISPEISSSTFSGIFRAICDFGEILGPIVCGFLLDRTNNVYWAFLCVCGIAWLGLAIFVAAPNQKPQAMTGATTPAAKEFAGNIECTVDK
jgi:MFS family permease